MRRDPARFSASIVGTSLADLRRVIPTTMTGKACLILENESASLGTEALEQAGMRARRTGSTDAALHEISTQSWHAVVVDLDVPDAIIVVRSALTSPVDDPAIITTSLHAGSRAVADSRALELPFVPKALLVKALCAWIVAAMNARAPNHRTARAQSPRRRALELSPREAAIFSLLTRGRAPKEIAQALGITHATVRTHARKAYRKMGVSNLREAMAALLDG